MKLTFWISVALVAYTFVFFPIVLIVLSGFAQLAADLRYAATRRDRRQGRRREGELPAVSLIIAAHNEESVIREKMLNCDALDYPAGRIEILVGCDGCTDATAAAARSAGLPNARIFELERSGKPATLNALVQHATGDVLVFSDANTMYEPGAVRTLLRHFDDERVGAVCGELRLTAPGGGTASEGLYWRYECFLKFLESRLNMLVGANGAIFASRRALFAPLPPGTINDDFLTAMHVRARRFRVVYDPGAVAWEEAAGSVRQEYHRRVRIGRGNLRALRHTWRLLLPQAGLVAVSYWSHKILRWLVPFASLAALVSAVVLSVKSGGIFYAACAAAGMACVALAAAGFWSSSPKASHPLVRLPCYFLVMNLGLLVGFLKDAVGTRSATWNPTPRAAAATADGDAAPADTAAPAGRPGLPAAGSSS